MARRAPRQPVLNAPPRVRQRQRADGTWRVWWEPRPDDVLAGFTAVELWPDRPDATRKEAEKLNAELARVRASGLRRGTARTDRSIEALVTSYRATPHFRDRLAPKTQDSYGKLLRSIVDKWGTERVTDFDPAVMTAWYQALYDDRGPRMAQALIRMMSILFGQAERLGWRAVNSNPCLRLQLVTPAPRHRTATWAEVEAMIAAAEADPVLAVMADAIMLALLHGQRATDVRTARRSGFAPAVWPGSRRPRMTWFLRRSKRGNAGEVPVHPDFLPRLERLLAAPAGADDALLPDPATGRTMSEDRFCHRWDAVRAIAAKACPSLLNPPLQFRDLRRTFGVLARQGGAARADVGDVLGNSAAVNPRLGETYMPATATTTARAIAAVRPPKKEKIG